MRSVGYLMYWLPGILLIISLAPGFSQSMELETSTSRNSSGMAKERGPYDDDRKGIETAGAWVVGGTLFIILMVFLCLCSLCCLPLCIWGCIVCAQRNRGMNGQGVPGRVIGPNPQMAPQPYYSNMGMQQQYSQPQQYPPPQQTA